MNISLFCPLCQCNVITHRQGERDIYVEIDASLSEKLLFFLFFFVYIIKMRNNKRNKLLLCDFHGLFIFKAGRGPIIFKKTKKKRKERKKENMFSWNLANICSNFFVSCFFLGFSFVCFCCSFPPLPNQVRDRITNFPFIILFTWIPPPPLSVFCWCSNFMEMSSTRSLP